ncbi:trace amine-associated receptor 13c-like [Triplophysa rosa]|uniref:Trace amine-associated receptor 13c-like n=1 Tax=Triplophysa rosa TaxID=992332 RepID=A0A9W7TNY5_TRIRA|nr:trace amine-associated receptor 13c-like [Triplophysa rosa]KAI7800171.1 putative trace amine-associated receptor 13c-like [Triplophysa rosa]
MEFIENPCLPAWNTSCSPISHLNYINILLFLYMSVMSVLTVCGNLLVIVCIVLFKQLHTPANLITLSLAVSDFLVGMCVMPVESFRSINPCFQMKKIQCHIFHTVMSFLGSASLINILLVAIDRYLAVCNPLQYVSKMTNRKTLVCITFTWIVSICYNVVILDFNSVQPGATVICLRECAVAVSESRGFSDVMITFISPCIVIVIMYVKILSVALRHAKSVSNTEKHRVSQMNCKPSRKSEMKATKTLASVVFLYLICWVPWCIILLNLKHFQNSSVSLSALLCLFYTNSCLNPFIYAISYPWFKRSVKLMVTFKILQTASKHFNLFSEDY